VQTPPSDYPPSPGGVGRIFRCPPSLRATSASSCANPTANLSFIKVLATYHPLAPRGFSRIFWDLELEPARADRTRSSCWQVCRPGIVPGIVAARSEHRTNPLDHLEKVRACTTRPSCTHPSHCPIPVSEGALPAPSLACALRAKEHGFCVGGAPPSSPSSGVAMGPPPWRLRRCAALTGPRPRTRTQSAPPCARLRLLMVARFALADACTRVVAPAEAAGMRARTRGVAAATVAAAPACVRARQRRRSRWRERTLS
jgi:hypothetical protein